MDAVAGTPVACAALVSATQDAWIGIPDASTGGSNYVGTMAELRLGSYTPTTSRWAAELANYLYPAGFISPAAAPIDIALQSP